MPKKSTIEYSEAGAPVSKVCTGCLRRLSIKMFGKYANYGSELFKGKCKPCQSEYETERAKKRREKAPKVVVEPVKHPDDRDYDWDVILQTDGWGSHNW